MESIFLSGNIEPEEELEEARIQRRYLDAVEDHLGDSPHQKSAGLSLPPQSVESAEHFLNHHLFGSATNHDGNACSSASSTSLEEGGEPSITAEVPKENITSCANAFRGGKGSRHSQDNSPLKTSISLADTDTTQNIFMPSVHDVAQLLKSNHAPAVHQSKSQNQVQDCNCNSSSAPASASVCSHVGPMYNAITKTQQSTFTNMDELD